MPWKFIKDLEPQKARGKLVESLWDDPDWIAEEKYDGERRIAQFCGKVVRFTGCPSRVTGVPVEKTDQIPHLSSAYKVIGKGIDTVPPAALDGTVLDGELILLEGYEVTAGGKSKAVTSIANSSPEEAVRKQIERGWLRYIVFDILYLKGRDVRKLPLWSRQKHLSDVVSSWGNHFVAQAERATGDGMPKRRMLDLVLGRGGEGVVLKHLDHRYGDAKGWVKVKAEWNADCVIMGFEEAKAESKKVDGTVSATKYAKAGLIGAIVLGQARPGEHALREVATVSGMDDQLRRDMTANPKKYIGRAVEIKHNGREPTGRFRHPRFKRLRTDKAAHECVYWEDET